MLAVLDSSFAKPTATTIAEAKAAGVRLWNGYLTTKPSIGIAAPWTKAEFDVARTLSAAIPIGYCSGNDDPQAVRAQAIAWNVRPCLDVEGGIRADGSWVQPWLDACGTDLCGLYGNNPVFANRRAAFFVEAAYPGYDPSRTWPSNYTTPSVPHGWQWEGTHTEFGDSVDRGWFDDWFLTVGTLLPGGDMNEQQAAAIGAIIAKLGIYELLLDRNDETLAAVEGWGQDFGSHILAGDSAGAAARIDAVLALPEPVADIKRRNDVLTGFAPLQAAVTALQAQVNQLASDVKFLVDRSGQPS